MGTTHNALFTEYAQLPEDLQVKMAITSNGPTTRQNLSALLLDHDQAPTGAHDSRLRMGFDITLSTWADNPLDLKLANSVWRLHRTIKSNLATLPEGGAEMLMRIMKLWQGPAAADLERFNALVASRQWEAVARLVKEQVHKGEAMLFWLTTASSLARLTCDYSLFNIHADCLPESLEPLSRKMRADAAFFTGDLELAITEYQAALRLCPLSSWRFALAGALLDAGQRDSALRIMLQAAQTSPWRSNDILRAHDLALDLDVRERDLDGAVSILLYTYNKPHELDQTLESLFASRIGGAHVTVLDNGSGEETRTVLCKWQERFGSQRFAVEWLPVNIGAPAARNWLLALPVAQAANWIAFLDDDVLLPPDWLSKLGAAVETYPTAGVWGCKIKDSKGNRLLQCVDLFIDPDSLCSEDPTPPMELDFSFSEELDSGQFDYIRPCMSVMGCCHLFRAEILRANGSFDIAFSPSQFDDVDHDLRLALSNTTPVYTGHLAVSHLRSLPHFSPPPSVAQRMGEMNKEKLRIKHAVHMPELICRQKEVLLSDMRAKRMRVSSICEDLGLGIAHK
jgi:GT2 family glycosyltransferase